MQLAPVLALGGERLDAGAAAALGLVLTESAEGGVRRVALENHSGATVRPAELGWRKAGPGDFDAPDLKLYVESWQMASPCGVRAWNDESFDYSPDYLPNCVSTPGDFHPGERGFFLADNMCCLRRPDGAMRLFGFTSGRDRFGHFAAKLGPGGVEAIRRGLWINDPDTLMVRDSDTELTPDETELWARAVSMAGGSLLLSDRLPALPPDRLAIARGVLAAHGAFRDLRPLDRWERAFPERWLSMRGGQPVRVRFDFAGHRAVPVP